MTQPYDTRSVGYHNKSIIRFVLHEQVNIELLVDSTCIRLKELSVGEQTIDSHDIIPSTV